MEENDEFDFRILDPDDYPISEAERLEISSAMKRSIADIEAGRGVPAREFFEQMRKKYNIPERKK